MVSFQFGQQEAGLQALWLVTKNWFQLWIALQCPSQETSWRLDRMIPSTNSKVSNVSNDDSNVSRVRNHVANHIGYSRMIDRETCSLFRQDLGDGDMFGYQGIFMYFCNDPYPKIWYYKLILYIYMCMYIYPDTCTEGMEVHPFVSPRRSSQYLTAPVTRRGSWVSRWLGKFSGKSWVERIDLTETIFYWVIYEKYMGNMVIYGCLHSDTLVM